MKIFHLDASHRWVFPDFEKVIWVAVCSYYFFVVFTERDRIHLTIGLLTVTQRSSAKIIELDRSICSTTTSCQ
uniref:Uncharacterized protein n=1 Tax=Parascaris equorum TaxID=6256 RepID=A0A914SAZ4_PAREQ